MMDFRTVVPPLSGNETLINYNNPIMLLGSCFTDNVGSRLVDERFEVSVNPCGTLYNPASIAQTLLDLMYEREYKPSELVERDGVWHSMDHHSRFSGCDRDAVADSINREAMVARDILRRASALIVTFGTAYMYRYHATGRIVANCHKLPAAEFDREMLTVDRCVGLWRKIMRELIARYHDLKVVMTVSPIRHLADGAHGNQLSKSTLLLSIDRIVSEFSDRVIYFPSYEMLIDDLRDYRFYAADMVHLSEVAVDYIYDRFKHSFMTADVRERARLELKATKRARHRPLISDK